MQILDSWDIILELKNIPIHIENYNYKFCFSTNKNEAFKLIEELKLSIPASNYSLLISDNINYNAKHYTSQLFLFLLDSNYDECVRIAQQIKCDGSANVFSKNILELRTLQQQFQKENIFTHIEKM